MWILKKDFVRLCKEYKTMLVGQNEQYLDFITNQEEPIIKKIE